MTRHPDPGALPAGFSRTRRLAELGLHSVPRGDLDEAAAVLGQFVGAAFAFVNLLGDDGQYFAGLYRAPRPDLPLLPRTMPLTHGFCPSLMARNGNALVLTDTHDHPRLRANPVVDELGARTYVGAPLFDPATGQTLATVCFIDTDPRPQETEHDLLRVIKTRRDHLNPRLFHPDLTP
ncbi:GAF domain-containing protein [Streptomyces sp. NPDC000594]|uniref:GAF domain-containing protein n=1 Tax=Streptomyces sp. NPDC000594 TaxID=3154261 RepID=UPI003328AC3D